MTSSGLLDTATLVLLGRLPIAELPEELLISAVTLAELSAGPLVTTNRKERAARQSVLQQAEADFRPVPFDADAARVFGRVAASLQAAGRNVQAHSYDAMIAATSIAHRLPLYTVNPVDFLAIEGLDLRPIPFIHRTRPARSNGPKDQ